MKKLIQLADEPSDIRTADRVKLLSREGEQVPALTYLIGETSHGTYFSQTTSMKVDLNISARSEFDPASLSGALKVLEGHLGYEPQAIWQTAEYYQSQLLAIDTDGQISSPTTRPGPGVVYHIAGADNICHFIGLPTDGWAIGNVSNIDAIPIRLNDHILRHHIILGGTTGMGKSNTAANIIRAANEAEFVPIIYDHKPDYIEITEPNPYLPRSEGIKAEIWSLGGVHKGVNKIYVPASELNPTLLGATIFSREGEDLMAEMFSIIIIGYANLCMQDRGEDNWQWDEFEQWFSKQTTPKDLLNSLPKSDKIELRPDNFSAIKRRLRNPERIPNWIRPPKASGWNPPAPHNFFHSIVPGSTHVIRLDGNRRDNAGYALFLDYSLGRLLQQREEGGPKVFNLIDEAVQLFKSGNRVLRDEGTNTLIRYITLGRSKGMGFCLALQSAGDVPEEIRQNLNSVIAFRHKHPSVLKDILPEQAHDIFGLVSNLQRGEAVAQLFDVRGLLHARMHLSPFKLHTPENR